MKDEKPYTEHDISIEKYRSYVFPNGDKLTIQAPKMLYIMTNGAHRVIDKDGVTWRPERGYIGITWVQTDGKPFTF